MQGWSIIATGADALIAAPTGSGKTLAAFLICLDSLLRQALAHQLPDATQVLYISPLKALSNDVHRNLEAPLAELTALAREHGLDPAAIRTAVRTGDTPAWERQQIGRKPPHILVTTPESLYILLTAERSRNMLRSVRTVIVDEIHAIAGDKRGSHQALSLARLDALTGTRAQRIGLSATVKPLEEVAAYLGPATRIVDASYRRAIDLQVEIPNDELGPVATNEIWAEIYDRIATHIQSNRTTLVFVNTRRLAERVSHALSERIGKEHVLPHHGSLSRALRHEAESRLKRGELKAVVATASLELGIDIGTVDLVCQIGSPRSFSATLQRVGRSGHWVGAQPKGRLFPTTRDELIECAALISGIAAGELERIAIPTNALDILAQQIVASAATDTWSEDALFAMCRGAYPYRNLSHADFDAILEILSEGITTQRGRSQAYLHRDRVNHVVKGRRNARLAAITAGGAIPENGNYSVIVEPEGKQVGTVDEDFAVESMAGDVFLLGTHSWRIRRVEAGRVRVEDAQGAAPSIPFWFGEAPGRSVELSAQVSRVRELLASQAGAAIGLDASAHSQALSYVRSGIAALGALPTTTTIVAERFFDEAGGMQLILHSPFGARINRAWGLALRKRFCRTFNFELQAAATDNGIVISLAEQHSFPLELVFSFVRPDSLVDTLTQAMLASPMFGARWRWNATRALAVLRARAGKRTPAPIQRILSDDLLAAVFPDQVACAENLSGPIRIPDHPLVRETIDNCLREAMDVDGLRRILEDIESGGIRTVSIDTAMPSPFCHEILNANPYAFLDDAPLEERRARAVQLRRTLPAEFAGAGILDPAAIAEISAEVWPEPRDADELHDALLTLISLPPVSEWSEWHQQLGNRACTRYRGDASFWIATEKLDQFHDTLATVRGWMECLGPVTAGSLAAKLAFPLQEIDIALATLEGQGQVLRGKFTASGEEEWCNRRILARIHRLTLGRLRREIEPVTTLQFYRFLCRWHHLTPGSQLHGADGVLQVIRQLQGYEIAAASWEPQILARRIHRYQPHMLDELCLSGEVMWGRLSPSSAREIRPTRVAPIAIFRREDADWLTVPAETPALSHAAQEIVAVLQQHGASFFGDLVRATHRLPSEVEDGLWELAAAGVVTADGFENLRALTDPKRRRGEGRGKRGRPRHAAGRWAILRHPDTAEAPRAEAFARQLLERWGVLFRDLLARETLSPPWRNLLPVLRRMEAQGEIRGGRFVAGFTGEQFARPEAVDLLRSMRRSAEEPSEALSVPNADPLNLAGIILPGARVSPLVSGHMIFGAQGLATA
ncbi:MAG: DEAD/DEAH box helicase [Bryobacterales bacterium]|nr:DEAD/DEAH box helicase [Bryobacterales bacterium]